MDNLDANIVAARLAASTKRLHGMAEAVGIARQVKEFAAERRRNLLAFHCNPDESVSKSELAARKRTSYLEELDELANQQKDAEITIAKWQAEMASFEAARSLLSFNRESLRQLEG